MATNATQHPLNAAQIEQLLAGPASVPPLGIVSDFQIRSALQAWSSIDFAATLAISTIAIVLRLFTRWRLMKLYVIEDYLIVCAMMAQIGQIVPASYAAQARLPHHMWDITLEDFLKALVYVSWSSVASGVATLFTKASLLLQCLRIFAPVKEVNLTMFYGCWFCLIANTTFYSIWIVLSAIRTKPADISQGPLVGHTFFYRKEVGYKATGIFNIVLDFAILLLPLSSILQLKVDFRKKVGIMGLFAAGFLACIASIMRTYYTWLLYETQDISWYVSIVGAWTWTESGTGILIFCLPTMPNLWSFLRSKVESWLSLRSQNSDTTSQVSKIDERGVVSGISKPPQVLLVESNRRWSDTIDSHTQMSSSTESDLYESDGHV